MPRLNITHPLNRRSWIAEGLVGWWKVQPQQGGGKFRDMTGRYHGTLNQSDKVRFAGGGVVRRHGSLYFTPSGTPDTASFVTLPTEPSFDLERTDSITVAAWVKPDNVSQISQTIIGKIDGTPYSGWALDLHNGTHASDAVLFQCVNDLQNGPPYNALVVTSADASITAGIWQHVAATYDGSSSASGVSLYINGFLVLPTTERDSLSASILNNVTPAIGGRTLTGDWPFVGNLDDVMLWKKRLTHVEIFRIFQSSREQYIRGEQNFVTPKRFLFEAATDSTFTATAGVTVGAATCSGSATFTAPTYTGTAAVSVAPATASGSATFTAPTYTAAAAVSVGPATASGSATFTAPVYTASAAVSAGAATCAGSATFSSEFTATAAVSAAPATCSGSATFVAPVYTGSAAVSTGPVTCSAAGTFTAPTYTGTLAVSVSAGSVAAAS